MTDKKPHRFQPGQSGNPGGRPKGVAEVQRLAREHTAAAIAELARIATQGESDSARVAAIRELLDRGYGKPAQPIDGDGEGGPIALSLKVEFVGAKPIALPVP